MMGHLCEDSTLCDDRTLVGIKGTYVMTGHLCGGGALV